jgi:excisionase family DNA binding protein
LGRHDGDLAQPVGDTDGFSCGSATRESVPVLRHDRRVAVSDGVLAAQRHGGQPVSGPLLTAADVAQLLGVPKSWVYEQSRAGRIPTVALGRYRRYRREAIERWLEELEAAAANGRARALAR